LSEPTCCPDLLPEPSPVLNGEAAGVPTDALPWDNGLGNVLP